MLVTDRRPLLRALLVASVLTVSHAHAQDASAVAEARRLFQVGSEHFLARRYDEALEALRRSNELVGSPNTGLLIARCFKERGLPGEAIDMYDVVEADARRRVADGDARYAKTAEAAVAERTQIKQSVGSLRVRVLHAPPGTKVEIGGQDARLTGQEIVVWRAPGDVAVRVKPPDGAVESSTVTIVAGAQARVEVDLQSHAARTVPAPTPPRAAQPASPESSRPWALPAALVSSGVAVLGFGAFAGFGLASQARYDDLARRCGAAGCGPADRADADTGKRYQVLANGGLIAGSIGAAFAITFFVLAATAGPERDRARAGWIAPGVYAW